MPAIAVQRNGSMRSVARRASHSRWQRPERLVADMLAAVEALLDGPDPFGALTIDDLTYASGVSRSTFYLYFESNADFLVTLGDGTADKLPGAVGSWWSLSPGAGKGRAQAGAA